MTTKPNTGPPVVTLVSVSSSASLIAAGVGTTYRAISNVSGSTLYVLFGAGTASISLHTVAMPTDSFYEFPGAPYSGLVNAALASGTGNVLVTTI